MDEELNRSLVEEREMHMAMIKALRSALDHIGNVAILATANPRKNEALLEIAHVADRALKL